MRRLFALILALWPALFAIPAYAQDPGEGSVADDAVIADVQFEGLRRVDADAVRLLITSRVGRAASKKAISDDIRAIYGTGYFDDVQALTEKKESGEIVLIFAVTEKPAIRRVEIAGNDDVSTEDIKNVVDLRPFTIFNEAKLKKNVQKVKDLYLGKGFYLVEVSSKVERVQGGEVVITIQIAENAKVQVRQIRIVGNHNIETDYLKGGLATQEGNLLSIISDAGTYRAEAFQVDLLRISSAYFDRGYINVKVEPPDIEISPDRKYLYITIRIEEGEQYSVGKLDFSGDLIAEKPELFDLIKSKEGEIFNRSMLGADLQSLKTRYEDDGYAYANITPLTQIDATKRTIGITFDIQKGNKVYYERINIVGNSKTRDKVIRRELRIYEGELTSATFRELSKRRVQALGYFEKVEIKMRKGSTDELQIVDVEVKERATGTFQIGAGLSSAENFIITAQIAQENFLGRGQSVALSASISGIQQQFQLRFTEPYLLDSDWTFSFDAFNYSTSFRSFVRQSFGGDLTLGHPIFIDELKLLFTYTLEFVQSQASDGVSLQPAFAALSDKGRISSLRATLLYDSRDNRLFPTEGHYHTLSVEVSDTFLGATESRQFQKYRLLNRYYHPVFWKVVGKLSARWGLINSSAPAGLAPSEKFILGGINSVRGYLPFSIGPERRATQNDRGVQLYNPYSSTYFFVEGGNKEFLLNLELEFPIFEEVGIKGVVFLDAGNTFAEDENFFYAGGKHRIERDDKFNLGTLPLGLFWSVGFGFRWFSPIGPLRFEWGIPLTRRPTDDPGPVFEFSIGNAF
ncbi:MAG: outer membrane protein assembly factor BamA [Myxococcota bacterium]